MRLITQFTIVFVLAAIVGGGWWFLTQDGDALPSKTIRKHSSAALVLVKTVVFSVEKLNIRAIGTGEALKSATIHPSASGEVIDVAFSAGQLVSKGAILLRIDDRHQRLAVSLAEVAVKKAARQVRRLERLAPSGAASVLRLETAQSEQESARLRLAQARAALRDRTVYAPFDGVIGLSDIEKGDRVSEQTSIAKLDDRSSILVEFNLSEQYADQIAIGDLISARPWTQPETLLKGKIVTLGSRIDPVSRNLRVKAAIPNPMDTIRPGTSFDVAVKFSGRAYATIPEVAVLWSRDGAYIWRVEDRRAEKVFISIVRRNKGQILVDGPLKEGETIVVEGVQGLRPGQQLRTKPFSNAANQRVDR